MKKIPQLVKYLTFLLVFLSSSIWFLYFSNQGEFLSVSFFDVGSGDAILIRTPDNFKILIDGGPSSKIIEYLGESLGPIDRKIDLLVLTHPHEDHVFGALETLDRYNVGMILGTGVIHTNDAYGEFLEEIESKHINFIVAEQGQIYKFGDLELEVLYPFEKLAERKISNLNNSSIVLKANYNKVKILFLGDAEEEVGKDLLERKLDLSASILKASHQGSKNGAQNVSGFLERVNSKIAIILVGENKFGHPHIETLENLENKGMRILRTDESGSIKIESDGEKFWVTK